MKSDIFIITINFVMEYIDSGFVAKLEKEKTVTIGKQNFLDYLKSRKWYHILCMIYENEHKSHKNGKYLYMSHIKKSNLLFYYISEMLTSNSLKVAGLLMTRGFLYKTFEIKRPIACNKISLNLTTDEIS